MTIFSHGAVRIKGSNPKNGFTQIIDPKNIGVMHISYQKFGSNEDLL